MKKLYTILVLLILTVDCFSQPVIVTAATVDELDISLLFNENISFTTSANVFLSELSATNLDLASATATINANQIIIHLSPTQILLPDFTANNLHLLPNAVTGFTSGLNNLDLSNIYLADGTRPDIINQIATVYLNGNQPETILFRIDEQLSLAENADVTGFSVNNGSISSAKYLSKGSYNYILLKSASNNQWIGGVISISYDSHLGNVTDVAGNQLVDIINLQTIVDAPPIATLVSISGSTVCGKILQGNYFYSDINNDSEGVSIFAWYRSDDNVGTNKTLINNALFQTYTTTIADIGKFISFEVTPVASQGNKYGDAVESSLVGPIINSPPTVSNITFAGNLIDGQTITIQYQYSDYENDPEGYTTFQWFESNDNIGTGLTLIAGAVASSYVFSSSDIGKFVCVDVSPVAKTGSINGLTKRSTFFGAVLNAAPVVSNVFINGNLGDGNILTGVYSYSDIENDLEANSIYKWYRSNDYKGTGKSVIVGANNSTYTLQQTDINKFIQFEVTPIAQTGTLTGTSIQSDYVGTIINNPPVASNLAIGGLLQSGAQISGSYLYSDNENNAEALSLYYWFVADDNTGFNTSLIGNSQTNEYIISPQYLGKYIRFSVLPIAKTGSLYGILANSAWYGPIINAAPVVSNITIAGNLFNGQTLTAHYQYSDLENDLEGNCIFQWFRSDNNIGTGLTDIPGAVSSAYTLTSSDIGKFISVQVIPVAITGTKIGLVNSSAFYGTVLNAAPSATNVSINGSFIDGNMLTGNYLYVDLENDIEQNTTFQWYRSNDDKGSGKSVIAGATNLVYTLQTVDINKYIQFDVQPSASTGTLTGAKVQSNYLGPVINAPPGANGLSITGILKSGSALTGLYSYADVENDSEGLSQYFWFMADDFLGTNPTIISTARTISYTITAANVGKYISFAVLPVAKTGSLYGIQQSSAWLGPIGNAAPVVSNITITGNVVDGQMLTLHYLFSDAENDAEGSSVYQWFVSDDNIGTNLTAITGANFFTYNLSSLNIGKYICVQVLPVAMTGTFNGVAKKSIFYGPILNSPPVAKAVTILGNFIDGQVLTGSYIYSDLENDLEGSSLYQWYRSDDNTGTNKIAINGATNLTYLLQSGDINKFIQFEVTPVSQSGNLFGLKVQSNYFGPLINNPPIAKNISINGLFIDGQIINVQYVYADFENDLEGNSIFSWFRADDNIGTNASLISYGQNTSYKLTSQDINKYIYVAIQPVAKTGSLYGNIFYSAYYGTVLNAPPTATNLAILGNLSSGEILTANYNYSDIENDLEGNSQYQWFVADDATGLNKQIINIAVQSTYTISSAFIGKYIGFSIQPFAITGNIFGTVYNSSYYGPIKNAAPKITSASLNGIFNVCQTIGISISYYDIENDLPGAHIYSWYSADDAFGANKTLLSTGVSSSYILKLTESNKYIFCEITPVAMTGTSVGNVYTTSYYGPVINNLPTSVLSNPGDICTGQSITLTATLTGMSPWSFTLFDGANNVGFTNITSNQYSIIVSTAGKYQITNLIDKFGCSAIASSNISVINLKLLPVIDFTMQNVFNVDDPQIVLSANPIGGIFSGPGVVGNTNTFYPSIAGVGAWQINYSYQDAVTGCTSQKNNPIVVNSAGGSILGLSSLYCYDANPFVITAVNPHSVTGTFSVDVNRGLTDNGNNSATLIPSKIGSGNHVITYTYFDGATFKISRTIFIDSVGVVDFIGLQTKYCVNDSKADLIAVNLYPLGGTGNFINGSGITSVAGSNNATFDPSLITDTLSHTVSYYYTSISGCKSAIVSKTTKVYPLPDVHFSIQSNYNLAGQPIKLSGLPLNGIFSGNGIINNTFYPSIIGLHTGNSISYSYIDAYSGCSNSVSKMTNVLSATGTISNLNSTYCYGVGNVLITGVPETLNVVGNFTSTKKAIIDNTNNTAFYRPTKAGYGYDTVFYSYFNDQTVYTVSKVVFIDSIGNVDFVGLENNYCVNDTQSVLTAIYNHASGYLNFSGLLQGLVNNGNNATLTPNLIPSSSSAYNITLTYISTLNNSNCKVSKTKNFLVNPLPVLDFPLKDVFSLTDSPYLLMPNLTGGLFTGDGVNKNYFLPSIAGLNNVLSVNYFYTNPITGCSNNLTKHTTVFDAPDSINGLKKVFCYKDTNLLFSAITGNFSNIFGLFSNSRKNISDNGNNTAFYNPAKSGAGFDTIYFTYYSGSTKFVIANITFIDSLSTVDFIGLADKYCTNSSSDILSAINLIPSGGNSFFSGPAGLSSIPNSNNALLNPKLIPPSNSSYSVSYFYLSPNGCRSNIVSKKFYVNSLPDVHFIVKDNYNVDDISDTLFATPANGIFSGQGVTGNIFYPTIVGVSSNIKLTYDYVDNITGCTSEQSAITTVKLAQATFSNLNSTYCTYTIPFIFTAQPEELSVTGTFRSFKNALTDFKNNSALYNPSKVGFGYDTVSFSYLRGTTQYQIKQSVFVDSIGSVDFTNLDPSYCSTAQPVNLIAVISHPSGTGNFSGFAGSIINYGNSATFNPSVLNANNSYQINYTYTSNLHNSGCVATKIKNVRINPLPAVNFQIKSTYNVNESPDTLLAVPSGGIFSGKGISSNIFYPNIAGLGKGLQITYKYSDPVTQCQNQITKSTNVLVAGGSINNLNKVYCYTDSDILITGDPNGLIGVYGNFFDSKNSIDNNNDNTAWFNPRKAGNGSDTIYFSYSHNGTNFQIVNVTFVDSIGNVDFVGLSNKYCVNQPQSTLTAICPSTGTGSFALNVQSSGFFNGGKTALLNPSLIGSSPASFSVNFNFVSLLSGCKVSVTKIFKINNLPNVSFNINPLYNVVGKPDTLKGNPVGGSFIGLGISNNIFYPSVAGTGGPYAITYSYADLNSCSNYVTKQTFVQNALAVIAGINQTKTYCIDDAVDTFFVIPNNGLPNGSFSGSGIKYLNTDSIIFNPKFAGAGSHIISYTYLGLDGKTLFTVSDVIDVDSIGQVDFVGLENQYCSNQHSVSALTALAPSSGTGLFTISPNTSALKSYGNIAFLTTDSLGNVPSSFNVVYKFISNTTGCVAQINKTFLLHAPTTVSFVCKNFYNIVSPPDTLSGIPVGGIFSGDGISGNLFLPNLANLGNHTISYSYVDANNCYSQFLKNVTIEQATEKFSGINSSGIFCYDAPSDTFFVLPDQGKSHGFFYGPGLKMIGVDTVLFTPSIAGAGMKKIYYSYLDLSGEILFTISATITVDSIGNTGIIGLSSQYCSNNHQITLASVNPLNGIGNFSIKPFSAAFFNGGNSALLFPSQLDYSIGNYAISYDFISNFSGCVKHFEQSSKTFAAPVVDFSLKKIYNIVELADTLKSFPSGGYFTGTGINGNSFIPALAKIGGPYSINYNYTDNNGCSASITHQTTVQKALENIEGLPVSKTYCINDKPDTIFVIPLVGHGLNNGIFSGVGLKNISGDTAIFYPSLAGAGAHTIQYTYLGIDSITKFFISTDIYVDSVGTVNFIGLNSKLQYCADDSPVQLVGIPAGGQFISKAVVSDIFYPNNVRQLIDTIFYLYINPGTGCSSTCEKSVNVYALPKTDFNIANSYCANQSPILLSGFPAGGAFSGSGLSAVNDSVYFLPSLVSVGIHSINYFYTDNTTGCSVNLMKNVQIFRVPNVTISSNFVNNYCAGTRPVFIKGLVDGFYINAGKFFGDGIRFSNNFGTAFFYTDSAFVDQQNIVSFRYTDMNGCENIDSSKVFVHKLPLVLLSGLDSVYCNNTKPVSMIGFPPGGIYTIDTVSSTQNIFDPMKYSGATQVSYRITDINSCSNLFSKNIFIHNAPDIHIDISNHCISDSIQFFGTNYSKDNIATWNWNFGTGNQILTASQNPKYLYSSGGIKNINLSAKSIYNCQTSKDTAIILGTPPIASFSWKHDCLSSVPTSFINLTVGAGNLYYYWNFGDNSNDSVFQPFHLFSELNQYTISLSVKNDFGCIDSISKLLYLHPSINQYPYFEDFEQNTGGWESGADYNSSVDSWYYGVPQGKIISNAYSGKYCWSTTKSVSYKPFEHSYLVGPCFDFSKLKKPFIKMNIWLQTEKGYDGVVLQYSVDDGVNWIVVGSLNEGINWYNCTSIIGNPGNQLIGQIGWSDLDSNWIEVRHSLDMLAGYSGVRFRIAFGSNGTNEFDGFAVDNIWIGERGKLSIIEQFTNANDVNSSSSQNLIYNFIDKNNLDFIYAEYHTNFPNDDPVYSLNPTLYSVRSLYYGVNTVPTTIINGNQLKDNSFRLFNNMNLIMNQSLLNPIFGLFVTAGFHSTSLTLNTIVKSYLTFNKPINLKFALVNKIKKYTVAQSDITYRNIITDFLPSLSGFDINKNFNVNDSVIITTRLDLSNIDLSNSVLIAFIQDQFSKEIYQCDTILLPVVSGILSIYSDKQSFSFSVNPIPASNFIHIISLQSLSKDCVISINDITGKCVQTDLLSKNANSLILMTNRILPGFYFLKISDRTNFWSTKILINK